ncbi:sensor histidine kinase [Lacinutrix sp. MEBiC02595]
MNTKKYRWILYLILTTIVLTIVVQGYWNYKNYLQNKQHFSNNVQTSLDNALDAYYADLAQSNKRITFIDNETSNINIHSKPHKDADSLFLVLEKEYKDKLGEDITGFTQMQDSSSGFTFLKEGNTTKQIQVIWDQKVADSLELTKNISSIYISILEDTLNFSKLSPLIIKELNRKKIAIPFTLKHFKNDSIINTSNKAIVPIPYLTTTSKSKFLKPHEKITMAYPNATSIILKEGLLGMLLSLVLALAIISSLFYLLKIIKHQKELAEVKNDLISNITHEFKTPIATISVALESIKNFNVQEDKAKTSNYLNISTNQLAKLNTMVEKLLETATLDSNSLQLVKEKYNITDLLQSIVDKHELQLDKKSILLNTNPEKILAFIDVFHIENAINNIVDNAIKYGGNKISIQLEQNVQCFIICISDNGNTLTKANKEKIFEQFYRVPKGNIHNVKGFGIGLYYTKKIIEKHNGTIQLDLENKQTTFKLTLPNA